MKNKRNLGCGTLALLAVFLCSGAFLIPNLFGGIFGGDNNADNGGQSVPETRNEPAVRTSGDIVLGNLVITNSIDRDGCPTNDVSTLQPTDAFYVVAPNSSIPANTDVFARLYRNDTPVEDLPIITSDRDYDNTCLNFLFEHLDGAFPPGDYSVEYWVNGNYYDSTDFRIR